ncbi:hypothetical protein [Kitasatospora kifunensis]|uniref:Uncharacterized protein (DUF983 family) n=1 Tax=Kitasatospora kifunensis TaxID=58351 RepID=A0A7W7VX01_KITKI|nr:hypothetical protein [Kitasatospora kifunensis]MBB4926052.1 uncharacterized protein (DUF983 family) [Kitasatospora kifunensis]
MRGIANTPVTPAIHTEDLDHPRSRRALRQIKLLVGGYLATSLVTLLVIALLRHDTAVVNSAVWVRASIVVVSALLTSAFTARAARGSRAAYRRLRIVSAVMVAGVVAVIALPGTFPLWLKLEQGLCGLLLIGVVALANGRQLRSLFAAP